jgi:hypothetical protein
LNPLGPFGDPPAPDRKLSIVVILLTALVAFSAANPPAVAQCNQLPIVVDDAVSTYGPTVLIDVLANDRDPEGEAMNVIGFDNGCPGTIEESFDMLSFTPDMGT